MPALPDSFNPAKAKSAVSFQILANLYEGLMARDSEGRAVYGLAQSHMASADGLVYTFSLRKNLRFSTGEPILAATFKESWLYALNPASAASHASLMYPIKGARAYHSGAEADRETVGLKVLDDYTFQVVLEQPANYALELFANHIFSPHLFWQKGDYQHGFEQDISFSGAYAVERFVLDQELILRRNANYWDAEAVATERVSILLADDELTAYNMYMAREINWLAQNVPVSRAEALAARPDFFVYPSSSIVFYLLNMNVKPLDDVRVRKALSLVLDRQAIVRYVSRLNDTPTSALVPPFHGYEGSGGLSWPHIREARKLLAEAGYPDGKGFPVLKIAYNNTEVYKALSQYLQYAFHQSLGIYFELQAHEGPGYMNRWATGDFELIRASWFSADYEDPYDYLRLFLDDSPYIQTGYTHSRYSELVRRGRVTLDDFERSRLYREAERLLTEEDVVLLPLYYPSSRHLFDTGHWEGFACNTSDLHLFKFIRKRGACL